MKKGFSLLAVMFFIAIGLLALGLAAKIMVSQMSAIKDETCRLKAFYAAEGAAEWAKAKIACDPLWFTDMAHSPGDDVAWLASGAKGFEMLIGETKCKIVREENRSVIYAIGYAGQDIDSSDAVSIVRIGFSQSPFKEISWKEL